MNSETPRKPGPSHTCTKHPSGLGIVHARCERPAPQATSIVANTVSHASRRRRPPRVSHSLEGFSDSVSVCMAGRAEVPIRLGAFDSDLKSASQSGQMVSMSSPFRPLLDASSMLSSRTAPHHAQATVTCLLRPLSLPDIGTRSACTVPDDLTHDFADLPGVARGGPATSLQD